MNSDKLKVSIDLEEILTSDDALKEIINQIVSCVDSDIIGRVANKYGDIELDNLHVMLKYVAKAGGGNHLEIGTLFGGSAIAVAMLKNLILYTGIIVCIDPLDGYYTKYAPREDMIDGVSGKKVTPKTLFRNLEKFGVSNRILVMQSTSQEFFNLGMIFSTAYIDGDHQDGVPLHDWKRIRDITSAYIIFDNWDDGHPDVQEACREADSDAEWGCVYAGGITYVVERKL